MAFSKANVMMPTITMNDRTNLVVGLSRSLVLTVRNGTMWTRKSIAQQNWVK